MSARNLFTAIGLIVTLHVASAVRAADFSVTKDVANGAFTLVDQNPGAGVFELVVAGLGTTAGTMLPGWSAGAFLFNDPLSCQPAIGSTITEGFCYVLTDPVAGSPITAATTSFTYDSSFDDQTVPSEFAVAFNLPGGGTGACFGDTGPGDGCNVPVPEPPAAGLLLTALLGVLVWRRARPGPDERASEVRSQ